MDFPTCSLPQQPPKDVCQNGGNNYPSCTTFNVCLNGAKNYPDCSSFDSCKNGADNPPACTNVVRDVWQGVPPIIDFHAHIVPSLGKAGNQAYIAKLIAETKKANIKVSKTVLALHAKHQHDIQATGQPKYSPSHDQWISELYQANKEHIIPFVGGFDPADPQAPAYVERMLKSGDWFGIGELDLRNQPKDTKTPANTPIMMKIYQVAAKYQVPVLIHYDMNYGVPESVGLAELDDAITKNPETTFIFAHSCPLGLLEPYSNLYCETEPAMEFPSYNQLSELKMFDRIILGTDIQNNNLQLFFPGGSYSYSQGIGILRTAVINNTGGNYKYRDMITHGNGQRILKMDRLPIIDLHAHIIPSLGKAANEQYIANLMEASEQAFVVKTILSLHAKHKPENQEGNLGGNLPTYSQDHDQWIEEFYRKYPDQIIPFIGGFDPADPRAPGYVKGLLQKGFWKGIGELDLRNMPKDTKTPANTPIMMEIYKIASEFKVPVLFHYDFDYGTTVDLGRRELEDAITKNPATTFVFAHSCPIDLMMKFNNLYCETELGVNFPTEDQLVQNNIFQRVLLGTDVQSPELGLYLPESGQSQYYAKGLENLRAKVNAETKNHTHFREFIMYKNASRLLNLNIK